MSTDKGQAAGTSPESGRDLFGGGVDDLIKIYKEREDQTSKLLQEEYFFGPVEDAETYAYRTTRRGRPPPPYRSLVDEYGALWAELGIRNNKLDDVKRTVERILTARRAYEAVESGTGVPWYVVAAIHNLESTLDFRTHLHNGDPLTARTVRVPSGRPRTGNPPFTWMESATDALRYRGLSGISDWSVPRICYTLEGYNGWGYRLYHSHVKSPYLWSFSNHYSKGKYTNDGKWSDDAVSDQIGGMVLLKLMSSTGLIRIPALMLEFLEDYSQNNISERSFDEEHSLDHDHSEEQFSDSGDDDEEPSAFDPGQLDPSAEEGYGPDDPSLDDLPLTADETRAFWRSRNPRGAVLYHRDGRPAVDPQLLEASAKGVRAWETQNSRYRVEMYGPSGGLRAPGRDTRNHTPQPRTNRGAAMDFVIIDRNTGKMLTNHPGARHRNQGTVGQNAPIYQTYYNAVVQAGVQEFQGFAQKARFGGYFKSGANAMDTMHIDMRGLEMGTQGGNLRSGFNAEQIQKWQIPANYPYRN